MFATPQSLINLDVAKAEYVNHKPANHNIYGPGFERLGANSGQIIWSGGLIIHGNFDN